MEPVQNVVKQVRWLLQKPTAELTRAQATLRYMIDLTRHCARELYHDRAPQMAAALTYHTLFSLVPTLVLMLVAMRVFVSDIDLQQFKESSVGYVMKWLEDATVSMAAGAEAQTATSKVDESNTAEALRSNIQNWLDELQNVDFKSIGIFGVLLFIYAATGLVATIERSFNQIFGAPSNRPWYMRMLMYYPVITLGPLLIVLGQYFQGQLVGWLSAESWTNWGVGPLAVATPLVASWLVLFAMYSLLPTARVRMRPAVIGSFFAAAGWVIAAELFGIYVRGAASTTLYGALGLLPLFLMWLWITWLIILFGLELSYTLQGMRGRNFKSLAKTEHADLFVDPKWLIPVMALIGERFEQGQHTRVETLSRALSLPVRAVHRLAEQLQQAGLINHVGSSESHDPGYALALPAEKIALSHLLELGHKLSWQRTQAQQVPGQKMIEALNATEQRAAGSETLATLLHRNDAEL